MEELIHVWGTEGILKIDIVAIKLKEFNSQSYLDVLGELVSSLVDVISWEHIIKTIKEL